MQKVSTTEAQDGTTETRRMDVVKRGIMKREKGRKRDSENGADRESRQNREDRERKEIRT